MEKEQILSAINEKLGQTSFSEKTISDYVEAFIPESEENPDLDKHVGFLKSLYGNYSADVAKQVNEAKEKLKPQPSKEDKSDDKRYSELSAKFDQLMDAHTKLTEQLAQKESKQTQEQLMSQVKAEMKKQGATDDYVLKQTLRGVTLDTKKSVADLTKEMLTAYDSEYTACRGKGAAPRNGGGSGGSNDKPYGSYFANKKAREKWGENSK